MKLFFALLTLSAATAFSQVTISAVLDGGGYTPDIPQGAVFVVKGSGLSAAGFVQATAPSYPTSLNNAQIKLAAVSGGNVVTALMVYTYNQSGVNQLAAVLPSTTPTGAYNLTVTNGGSTSAAFRMNVVANKPGIITADGSGSGQAQATIGGGLILDRASPQGIIGIFDTRIAHPGERMDFWGTGLGADANSDVGGTSGDKTADYSVRVIFDGVEITPVYAGRSQGYPGLDQIVIILPSSITPKCTNKVQIRSGAVLGNVVTVATSADGSSSCPASITDVRPLPPETAAWLANGMFRSGSIGLLHTIGYQNRDNGTQIINKTASYTGSFQKITGDLQGYLNSLQVAPPTPGLCNVVTGGLVGSLSFTYLDAGASISATGPNGPATAPKFLNGPQVVYTTDAGTRLLDTYIVPGHYTYSGVGGPNVGALSGTFDMAPELVWTEAETTRVIDRTVPLTVHWTGGDPETLVTITGISGTTSFQCYANNGDRQFTVPTDVLGRLTPSVVSGSSVQRGTLNMFGFQQVRLTPPSGIDYMIGSGEWSTTATLQYK